MTPATTYARFAPYVRRRLADLGVPDADLPDLCQEVFLVVHGKEGVLPAVERVDLWLREICRRVAAGYRRRAAHRLEVLDCDTAERPDPRAEAADEPDLGARISQLRRALNHLDDESRDLLALHDAGAMPLTQLAKLVERDRKTVRSRLERARRRVSRWLCGAAVPTADGAGRAVAPRATPTASPFMRDKAARGREHGCSVSDLEILRVSPEHCSGALGNVAVSDWRGPEITAAAVASVIERAPYTLEKCGGDIAYLAVIEPTVRPPTLEARQKIVDVLELVGPYFNSFAVVLLGANTRINQPILEGLTLLARPRFPMCFFSSVSTAVDWLCQTTARDPDGPIPPAALAAAVEHVRRIDADRESDRRRVRSFRIVSA
jgi:RNA polymerase sigma-70 factor (ECF subfamily)